MGTVNISRPYHSPLRQEQAEATRARIVASARTLFTSSGYAGTTVEDIAAPAGVSARTIYAVFGSKLGLLRAVRNKTLGDGETAYAKDRDQAFAAVLKEPDPRRRLERHAQLVRTLHDQSWEVLEIERAAAGADPEVAALWLSGAEEHRAYERRLARSLARQDALRAGLTVNEAADVLVSICGHDVFLRLVIQGGWTQDRYQTWLQEALPQLLLR